MYDKVLNSLKSEEKFLIEELNLKEIQKDEAQKRLNDYREANAQTMNYLYTEFGEISDLGDRAQNLSEEYFKAYDKVSAGIYSSIKKGYSELRNLIRTHQVFIKEQVETLRTEYERRRDSYYNTKANLREIQEKITAREKGIVAERNKQAELNKTIAILAEIPTQYLENNNFIIKTDPSGNKHHIYFGGQYRPDGFGHGHYFYNNGSIKKIREVETMSA